MASEIDVPDDALRRTVVEALIHEAAKGTFVREWGTTFENLRHSSLADQLRPELRSEIEDVRLLALDLAGQGHAADLEADLIAISLDPAEPEYVRYRCILTLLKIGWQGPHLLALLDNPALLGDDPKRELRGAIIEASWPHSLSTADALRYINVEPAPWFFGHYSLIVRKLADSLREADLDAAASWLQLPVANNEWFSDLRDAALGLCADNMQNDAARDAAMASIRLRLRTYQPAIGSHAMKPPAWEDSRRHAVLLALAIEATEDELLALVSTRDQDGLLKEYDFLWLVSQIDQAEGALARGLSVLIEHTFSPDKFEHANCLASLPADHVLLKGALAYWCGSVELTSAAADKQRETWSRYRRRAIKVASLAGPDEVNSWIDSNLDLFEEGNLDAYAHALLLTAALPGTRRLHEPFQPDITKHERWEHLTDSTRRRLVEGAVEYLMRAKCQPDIWLSKDLHTLSSEGAYRALILLSRMRPEKLEELSPESWLEWAPIIVAWRPTVNGASAADQEVLMRKALPHARGLLKRALLHIISTEDAAGRRPFVENECEVLWGVDLATDLASLLQTKLSVAARDVAAILMQRDPELGRPILYQWVEEGIHGGSDRLTIAFEVLMACDAPVSWPKIWGVMARNPTVAVASVLDLADRDQGDLGLDDKQLGTFHAWMEEQFPRTEDEHVEGAHTVTKREQAGRWRDRLFEILIERGTAETVEALSKFAAGHTEQGWRKAGLARALRAKRESEWEPLTIGALAQLGQDKHSRMARSDQELSNIVREALVDIQERIVGNTPESHLLWETRVMRPKSEDEVSDYLLNRLRDRLETKSVVVNREVQVRRNSSSGIPERTDLLIEAFRAQDSPIRVVVEVKGAWSVELMSAIPEQLVGRYLKDYPSANGVYIVLWPDVGSWSAKDGREDRTRMARLDRLAIELDLSEQADEAARSGYPVQVVHLDIPYRRLT
ncbi:MULTISPECIES: hypothetical protein [unclassified Pseudarthrobacter]|uniref:hypothetical protein n=1 Tax=unclassified Pseudarthrobacter TaxID=2647000 RepID=UPI0036318DCA